MLNIIPGIPLDFLYNALVVKRPIMEAVLKALEGQTKDVYKIPERRTRLEFVQGGGARSDFQTRQSGGATKGPLIKLNAGFAVRSLANISKPPSPLEAQIIEDIKNLDFVADEEKLFKWLGLDNTFLEKKISENPDKFYKFWHTVVTADATDGWHLMTGKEAQKVSNYLSDMAEARETYLRSVAVQYLRGEEVATIVSEEVGKADKADEKEMDLGEALVKEGEASADVQGKEDIYDLKTYEAIEARVLDKVEDYKQKFFEYVRIVDYFTNEYRDNTNPSADILKLLGIADAEPASAAAYTPERFRENILGFFDKNLRPIRNAVQKEVDEIYTKLSAVRKKITSLKTSSPPDTAEIQNLEKLLASSKPILDKLELSASLLFYCGEIFLKLLDTEPDFNKAEDYITLNNSDIVRLKKVLSINPEDYYKNPSLIPEKKESLESRLKSAKTAYQVIRQQSKGSKAKRILEKEEEASAEVDAIQKKIIELYGRGQEDYIHIEGKAAALPKKTVAAAVEKKPETDPNLNEEEDDEDDEDYSEEDEEDDDEEDDDEEDDDEEEEEEEEEEGEEGEEEGPAAAPAAAAADPDVEKLKTFNKALASKKSAKLTLEEKVVTLKKARDKIHSTPGSTVQMKGVATRSLTKAEQALTIISNEIAELEKKINSIKARRARAGAKPRRRKTPRRERKSTRKTRKPRK